LVPRLAATGAGTRSSQARAFYLRMMRAALAIALLGAAPSLTDIAIGGGVAGRLVNVSRSQIGPGTPHLDLELGPVLEVDLGPARLRALLLPSAFEVE